MGRKGGEKMGLLACHGMGGNQVIIACWSRKQVLDLETVIAVGYTLITDS